MILFDSIGGEGAALDALKDAITVDPIGIAFHEQALVSL